MTIKVSTRDLVKDPRHERDIMKKLNEGNSDHDGYAHVIPLLDAFVHEGPNGPHTQTVSFGGRSRIRLPLFLRSADGRCELQSIKLQGHCDKSSWREVWDYGVELNGVCAAQKKRGNSPAFGANGRLLLSLVPKWPVSES